MNLTTARPITYLITRGEATSDNFAQAKQQILDIIAVAVEEKVSMIQIREKRLHARLLGDLTEAVVALTRDSSTKVLVNDRIDIAMASGADGVHLTGRSIPAIVVRKLVPDNFLVGVSAHSQAEVETAVRDEADFVVLGPIFDTPGKGEPLGLERFGEICRSVHPFPVLGLGGVGVSNITEVLSASANGLAAIRAMNDEESLRSITTLIRE